MTIRLNTTNEYRSWEEEFDDYWDYVNIVAEVSSAFRLLEHGWNAYNISSYVLEEFVDNDTFLAMYFIAIAKKEIELGMLEERVHDQICHYIPAYKKGDYDNELHDYEKEQLDKDITYILSKVDLYEVHKLES